MHIHFLYGAGFITENFAIIDEISKRYGKKAKFSATVAARYSLFETLNSKAGTSQEFYKVNWLSTLEKHWLETPLDRKKLKKYEEMLGTDVLRRIIAADRELGYGLVTCGTVEHTQIIERTHKNDEARWAYLVGLLDYIFDFYKKEKPDLVFLYCIAGAVSLAMAEVAEYLNVPYAQVIFARVNDYQILDDDPLGRLKQVKALYEKALKKPALIKDKQEEADAFFDTFLNRPEMPVDTRFWIKKIMREYSVQGMLKNLIVDTGRCVFIYLSLIKKVKDFYRQPSPFDMLKNNLKKFFQIHYMLRFQKRQTVDEIVGDNKFLYFPLHVDPEMSTMVLADKLTEQVAVIERISRSMPAGYKLIVKEHIPCIGKRPKGIYKRIKRLPDVHLISPFNDNFEILKKTALTVTITGSACWESIMLGKPPVILGNVHFTNLGEGFVHCANLNNLETAIQEAFETKPASKEKIKTYIASLMHSGFELSMIDIWFGGKHDDTNLQKAASTMVDQMETIIKRRRAA